MTRIVIVTRGTAGDVVPFLEIGTVLQRRGNEVVLVTHSHYSSAAARLGLRFEALDTPEEFHAFVNDVPLLDTPGGILPFLERHIFPHVQREVDILESCCVPDAIVLTRHMSSFAASVVQERHRLPLATVFEFAAQAGGFQMWIEFCRSVLASRINDIRRTLKLPPVTDWRGWLTSPEMFLAGWPEWFAPSCAVWPVGVRHMGFLHSDATESGELPTSVELILQGSPVPVLITGGTSVGRLASRFYRVAAAACEAVGRPAILVCRHEEFIPPKLPARTVCCRELPFASVMPRASAVIHHGGSGTMIRAVVSGTPQIILPFGADRPDNAARMQALGAAIHVRPTDWEPEGVGRVLAAAIGSGAMRLAIADLRERMSSGNDLQSACSAIEQLSYGQNIRRT